MRHFPESGITPRVANKIGNHKAVQPDTKSKDHLVFHPCGASVANAQGRANVAAYRTYGSDPLRCSKSLPAILVDPSADVQATHMDVGR
jgi:hypothetical protein